MPSRPLCFVLVPVGRRSGGAGGEVDFDSLVHHVVEPAIRDAGLEPVRADQEVDGGIVQRSTFERLILCDVAVADLTTASAGVFYELGVRHAVRPSTTVLLVAQGARLPIDLDLERAFSYPLDAGGRPADVDATRAALVERLEAASEARTDSPLYELVDGFVPPDVARLKTDVFRERVQYSTRMKRRLAEARDRGIDAVRAVEAEMGDLDDADAAVVVDLLLSYRALGTRGGWEAMVDLVGRMSGPLAGSTLVQEQLGLALNRLGRPGEAVAVLTDLVGKRGPSSETSAILGRVYKDRWAEALGAGDEAKAREYLDEAIDRYLEGFEADWRDPYPGINALVLMEVRDPPDGRAQHLLPVVRYSAARRLASGNRDYWDHATMLELAVLAHDEPAARAALEQARSVVREPWEPQSTANNLALVRRAREHRGDADAWAKAIEDVLVSLKDPTGP